MKNRYVSRLFNCKLIVVLLGICLFIDCVIIFRFHMQGTISSFSAGKRYSFEIRMVNGLRVKREAIRLIIQDNGKFDLQFYTMNSYPKQITLWEDDTFLIRGNFEKRGKEVYLILEENKKVFLIKKVQEDFENLKNVPVYTTEEITF